MFTASLNETILVDHQVDNFIVEDLAFRRFCFISDFKFHGIDFKYECDFISKFLKCFEGKNAILFTTEGKEQLDRILNANREGIYE